MIPLLEAAAEIQEYFDRRGWRSCIIGGFALQRWGTPRTTQDVDFTLLTGIGDERRFFEPLFEDFVARRPDCRQLAEQSRVVLIQASNKVPIDISLGWLPYEERLIERASSFEFALAQAFVTCSAEDLMLKAFANRPRDWVDVEDIIAIQSGRLDWSCIEQELDELCQLRENTDPLDRIRESRQRLD